MFIYHHQDEILVEAPLFPTNFLQNSEKKLSIKRMHYTPQKEIPLELKIYAFSVF